MTIGQKILDEICKQGMVAPDEQQPNVLIWAGNAADQLDALVEAHVKGLRGSVFTAALCDSYSHDPRSSAVCFHCRHHEPQSFYENKT